MPRDELLRQVKGKQGVLSMLTDEIDEGVLEAAGRDLMIIANYGEGCDNIDVKACTRRSVLVANTPDIPTAATADLTWALILSAARRVAEGDRMIRAGRAWSWAPTFMIGQQVSGKTLGIVGFGRVGQAVARRARCFGMKVIYSSRNQKPEVETRLAAEYQALSELLPSADFVSVHVSPSPATYRLFGRNEFRAMKSTAVFINTSRGAVVDEAALADALLQAHIFAAALDVYENEPAVHRALLQAESVLLVPHVGSATVETRTAMGMVAAESLIAGLRGMQPPTLVNTEAWTLLSHLGWSKAFRARRTNEGNGGHQ